MDEEKWLVSVHVPEMLGAVKGRSDRKLRLFACTCGRMVWNPFVPPFAVRVTAAAEAFADGGIDSAALARVYERARESVAELRTDAPAESGYIPHVLYAAMCAAMPSAFYGAFAAVRAAARAAGDAPFTGTFGVLDLPGVQAELDAQTDLLRDIFGNPFREVELDPTWGTSDVLAMAQGMYANREFSAMPILADALEDAGCDDEGILDHCREDREHVRGCWVVDLLLGKE
jgi:hypothetical protein